MKFKIFKFKKVTSTNDFAIKFNKKKKEDKLVMFMQKPKQKERNLWKKWVSKKGNLF